MSIRHKLAVLGILLLGSLYVLRIIKTSPSELWTNSSTEPLQLVFSAWSSSPRSLNQDVRIDRHISMLPTDPESLPLPPHFLRRSNYWSTRSVSSHLRLSSFLLLTGSSNNAHRHPNPQYLLVHNRDRHRRSRSLSAHSASLVSRPLAQKSFQLDPQQDLVDFNTLISDTKNKELT